MNKHIQKRSETNSGFLNLCEKIIRRHPLIYFFVRKFIRYTNIFEEDAIGIKKIKFKNKINIIDVGASDGIASKFFLKNLKVNKIICFEPNKHYFELLKNLDKKIIPKNFAISNRIKKTNIYYPVYKSFFGNFELIPYTYYDIRKLRKQINLDFSFKKNLIIKKTKLKFNKFKNSNYKIDLIKIDVNDHGFNVLKCLLKTIKRHQPALLVETDADIFPIFRELKKLGYKQYYFSISNSKFYEIKKNYPLNTYFLLKKHLN